MMKDETCANCAHFNTKRYINGKLIHRADSVALCSLKKDKVSYWSRCNKFAPCKEYQELLNKEIEEKHKKELIKQKRELEKQHEKEMKQITEEQAKVVEYNKNEYSNIDGSYLLSADADKRSKKVKQYKQRATITNWLCVIGLILGIIGFALIAPTKGNGFCIALGGIGSGLFVITLAIILVRKFGK